MFRPVPESLYLFGSVAARTLPKRTAGLWQFGRISPGKFHDSEFESSQEMAPQQFLAGITGGRATSSVVKRNMSYLKATLISCQHCGDQAARTSQASCTRTSDSDGLTVRSAVPYNRVIRTAEFSGRGNVVSCASSSPLFPGCPGRTQPDRVRRWNT